MVVNKHIHTIIQIIKQGKSIIIIIFVKYLLPNRTQLYNDLNLYTNISAIYKQCIDTIYLKC